MRETVKGVLIGAGVALACKGLIDIKLWRQKRKLAAKWKPRFEREHLAVFDRCIEALGEDFAHYKFNWGSDTQFPTNIQFIPMADIQAAIREQDQSDTAVLTKMGLMAVADLHQRLAYHLDPEGGKGSADDLYTICAMKTMEILLRWFERIEQKALALEAHPDRAIDMTALNHEITGLIQFLSHVQEAQKSSAFLRLKRNAFDFKDFALRFEKLRDSYQDTLQPVVLQTFKAYQSDLPRQLRHNQQGAHDLLERLRAILAPILLRDRRLTFAFDHRRTHPQLPPNIMVIDASKDSRTAPKVVLAPETPVGDAFTSLALARHSLKSEYFEPPRAHLPLRGTLLPCPVQKSNSSREAAYVDLNEHLFDACVQLAWFTDIASDLTQGRAALFVEHATKVRMAGWLGELARHLTTLKSEHFFNLALTVFYERGTCHGSEAFFAEIDGITHALDDFIHTLSTLKAAVQDSEQVDADVLREKIQAALSHVAALVKDGFSAQGNILPLPVESERHLQHTIAQVGDHLRKDVILLTTGMSDMSIRARIACAEFIMTHRREPTPLELAYTLMPDELPADSLVALWPIHWPSRRYADLCQALSTRGLGEQGAPYFPWPSDRAHWATLAANPLAPGCHQQIALFLLASLECEADPSPTDYDVLYTLCRITEEGNLLRWARQHAGQVTVFSIDKATPVPIQLARSRLLASLSQHSSRSESLTSLPSERSLPLDSRPSPAAMLCAALSKVSATPSLNAALLVLFYPERYTDPKQRQVLLMKAVLAVEFLRPDPDGYTPTPEAQKLAAKRIAKCWQHLGTGSSDDPLSPTWKYADRLPGHVSWYQEHRPDPRLTHENAAFHHLLSVYGGDLFGLSDLEALVDKHNLRSTFALDISPLLFARTAAAQRMYIAHYREAIALPSADFFLETPANPWPTKSTPPPTLPVVVSWQNALFRHSETPRVESKIQQQRRIAALKDQARQLVKGLTPLAEIAGRDQLEEALFESIALYRLLCSPQFADLKHYDTWLSRASDGCKGTSQSFAKISGVFAARLANLDLQLAKDAADRKREYQSPIAGQADLEHLIHSRKSGFRHRFWCFEATSTTGSLYQQAKRSFIKRQVKAEIPITTAVVVGPIVDKSITALEEKQTDYLTALIQR